MVEGLVVLPSRYGPKDTMNRLVVALNQRGMTVFARIDHAAGAEEAGFTLRPTEVLIFGSARAGSPLMQAAQTLGIDLPLRALVWQDKAGNTQLGYNDPVWLAERHGVDAATHPGLSLMADTLAAIAREAAT